MPRDNTKSRSKDVLLIVINVIRYIITMIGGVTTEENIERSPEGLVPPAVTIIAYEHNFYGWKNSTLDYTDNYKKFCEEADSSDAFVSCVKNHTFSLEDAVSSAYKGFFLDYPDAENLTGDDSWSWDMTSAWQGR